MANEAQHFGVSTESIIVESFSQKVGRAVKVSGRLVGCVQYPLPTGHGSAMNGVACRTPSGSERCERQRSSLANLLVLLLCKTVVEFKTK